MQPFLTSLLITGTSNPIPLWNTKVLTVLTNVTKRSSSSSTCARLYVEALLVDEILADQVWELWNAGVITDGEATWAWFMLAQCVAETNDQHENKIR